MMHYILICLAFISGMGLAFQASINAQLRLFVGHSISAALISFIVGLFGLFGVLLAIGEMPSMSNIKSIPLWAWAGGLFGAFFIAVSAYAVRNLGPAFFFSLVISGQLLVALLIDHYGLLGQPTTSINVYRIFGLLLLLGGTFLIKYKV